MRPQIVAFLDRILEEPSYGWKTESGALVAPSHRVLLREAFRRMNIFRSRKNWLAFSNWFWTLSLSPFFVAFFLYHFSWPLVFVGFIYSMVGMGSFGTVWLHRYGTHGAYTFSNGFWRFLVSNLVIKVVPEEIYILSHHVHHAKSEEPGDPYNAKAGALYCYLADTNHQPIATNLSQEDYDHACRLLESTGIKMNSYEQYQKWGSIADPLRCTLGFALNWLFWYAAFYLVGGHALATALFGSAIIWALGIRQFNYDAHGGGKDIRREGIDFNQRDLSVNKLWPGTVAGEWHNNHHLFATSARNGFLPTQLDGPYYFIRFLAFIGAVDSYRDHTEIYYERHYLPYLEKVNPEKAKRIRARRVLKSSPSALK